MSTNNVSPQGRQGQSQGGQHGGNTRIQQAEQIGDQNQDGNLDMYQNMGSQGGSSTGVQSQYHQDESEIEE